MQDFVEATIESIDGRLEDARVEESKLKAARAALLGQSAPAAAHTAKPSGRRPTPQLHEIVGEPASSSPRGRRRQQPGGTKARVLGALGPTPKTAGDISTETGLGRGTVSTTLSKMARAGQAKKAERGYVEA